MRWTAVAVLAVPLLAGVGCKRGGKKKVTVVDEASDASVARVIDAAPPRPRGKDIMVVVESRPPGATVSMDGRVLGKTPLTEPTVGDGREHAFRFVLDGHDEAVVKMMLMRDGVVTGVLVPSAPGALDGGR